MARLLGPAQQGTVFSSGWRAPAGGSAEVVEKATGARLTTTGLANPADINAAVAAAKAAQPGWAATPPAERAAVLRAAATVLDQARDEVAEWIVREGGGVRAKAEFEIGAVADEFRAAAELPTRPHGVLLPAEPDRHSIARRVPVGVVGVISPWNMPLLLGIRAVAPALALGNAVVLKPDPRTAVAGGLLAARLLERAGVPRDVLHVLPGDARAGAALTEHPDTAMIAFTGSTSAGRLVGATTGRLLKRASLELGGNNALIVLDDADLDLASSAGAWGSFFHSGQVCMSTGRHIVLASVAEQYTDLLAAKADRLRVGDPWTEQVDLGPLIDAGQRDRVHRIVTESVAAGAAVRTGGRHTGLYYRPTVLTGVTADMPAFTEEIFGPVAPVVVVADEDEAVAVADQTEFGLSAAVQTGDTRRGRAVADRLATGLVHVNDQTINDEAHIPFGGRGCSGNGSRHGAEQNWAEFTEWQWLTVRETPARYPF